MGTGTAGSVIEAISHRISMMSEESSIKLTTDANDRHDGRWYENTCRGVLFDGVGEGDIQKARVFEEL
jgi:hypothetical protein